jgi:hypothetical protein
MGTIMRRFIAPVLLLGVMAAGLGCQRKHVGGMNDVYHHPDNAQLNLGAGNPYRASGAPIHGTPVPEKMPAPIPVDDKKGK